MATLTHIETKLAEVAGLATAALRLPTSSGSWSPRAEQHRRGCQHRRADRVGAADPAAPPDWRTPPTPPCIWRRGKTRSPPP